MERPLPHIRPRHQQLAAVDIEDARKQMMQRSLARTGASDNAENLSFFDGEIESADYLFAARVRKLHVHQVNADALRDADWAHIRRLLDSRARGQQLDQHPGRL